MTTMIDSTTVNHDTIEAIDTTFKCLGERNSIENRGVKRAAAATDSVLYAPCVRPVIAVALARITAWRRHGPSR